MAHGVEKGVCRVGVANILSSKRVEGRRWGVEGRGRRAGMDGNE